MGAVKIPLTINLDVNSVGMIRPRYFIWPDNGKAYVIDRVIDICRAAALKAGGVGTRYRCRVCGKEVDIFCDDGKWFMEKSDPPKQAG